jgi:hypothetical protein
LFRFIILVSLSHVNTKQQGNAQNSRRQSNKTAMDPETRTSWGRRLLADMEPNLLTAPQSQSMILAFQADRDSVKLATAKARVFAGMATFAVSAGVALGCRRFDPRLARTAAAVCATSVLGTWTYQQFVVKPLAQAIVDNKTQAEHWHGLLRKSTQLIKTVATQGHEFDVKKDYEVPLEQLKLLFTSLDSEPRAYSYEAVDRLCEEANSRSLWSIQMEMIFLGSFGITHRF